MVRPSRYLTFTALDFASGCIFISAAELPACGHCMQTVAANLDLEYGMPPCTQKMVQQSLQTLKWSAQSLTFMYLREMPMPKKQIAAMQQQKAFQGLVILRRSCAQPPRIITTAAAAIMIILIMLIFGASAAPTSSCPSASSSPATLLQGARALRKDKRDAAADACLRQACCRSSNCHASL